MITHLIKFEAFSRGRVVIYSDPCSQKDSNNHPNAPKVLLNIIYGYYRKQMKYFTLIDLCKLAVLSKEELELQINDSPSDITLEITRKCPLHCLICSSNGGKQHPFELSLDKWIEIIDESIELGVKSFLISGGEPFCSILFKDLIEYISIRGVSFSIYTSGNCYHGQELSSLRYDDLVFISNLNAEKLVFNLEGSNERTHDLMTCVKGSFNNTISSIQLAVKLGLCTELHFVPTSINYEELLDVVSLARRLGVKRVSILRFVAQGRGKDNVQRLELTDNDLLALRDIFNQLEEDSSFVRIGSPFNPFILTKNYQCTAGRRRMTIRYDGRVVPCEAMKFLAEKYEDNDARLFSLKEIWRESEIFHMARSFYETLNSECVSCEFLTKCWGGCPAQRLLAGNINNIDPYCTRKLEKYKPITMVHD